MNNLSWLIYWADVAPAVSTFVAVIAFLLAAASGALLFTHLAFSEDTEEVRERDPSTNELKVGTRPTDGAHSAQKLWWSKITLPVFLILWGAAFLVPSKETFYLIAASESGEAALDTPEATKVRQLLTNWLDEQLAESAETPKEEAKP